MLDGKENEAANSEHTPLHSTKYRRTSLPEMETPPLDYIFKEVDAMTQAGGLQEHAQVLKRGAHIHHYPSIIHDSNSDLLSAEEKESLLNETAKRWAQPFMLYFLVAIGALAAVAQGMDETVVNGAQLYFHKDFGIENDVYIQGLLNSCPYLAAALVGCWIAIPMNKGLGRRGTIFMAMLITISASLYEAFSPSWYHLLGARLILGVGIGAASATVPVFTAECVPTPIRGGLVMFWQTFTAFGIMIGYIVDVAFVHIRYPLNWRLMMGSTFVVPLIVAVLIFFVPESPRWLVHKKKYKQAFQALKSLRNTELQAARDLIEIQSSLAEEVKIQQGHNLFFELFSVPRNRRATVASWTVMFMQQFCGVNIIMYYSSQIFVSAGVSETNAIYASLGAGVLNFMFAIPSIFLIDKAGRRPLLLWTFPFMSAFLLFVGFSFHADSDNLRLILIATGIYLFIIAFSPGEGPVPFTYAGEAFPNYIRDVGMSSATAVTWMFSFILGFSFPNMLESLTPTGAFGFYSGWCAIGWVLIFCLVPETKGLTLEQLDEVFSIPTRTHIRHYLTHWGGQSTITTPVPLSSYQQDEKA